MPAHDNTTASGSGVLFGTSSRSLVDVLILSCSKTDPIPCFVKRYVYILVRHTGVDDLSFTLCELCYYILFPPCIFECFACFKRPSRPWHFFLPLPERFEVELAVIYYPGSAPYPYYVIFVPINVEVFKVVSALNSLFNLEQL